MTATKTLGVALGIATLTLSLAACASPTPEPETIPAASTTPAAPRPTASPSAAPGESTDSSTDTSTDTATGASCFIGRWSADLDDLAAQLGSFLAGSGVRAESVRATGSQEITVDPAGTATVVTGVRYSLRVDLNGTALDLTQDHIGHATGDWLWEGPATDGTVTLANLDSDYSVDNIALVDGVEVALDIPVDASPAVTTEPMQVSCFGDTLVTHQDPAPFTITWHRVG